MRHNRPTLPTIQSRYCIDCRTPIVGIRDLGIDLWLESKPLTRELEEIFHEAGRPTYAVEPKPRRQAILRYRNPVTAATSPVRGVVLLTHLHQTTQRSATKAPMPSWVIDDDHIQNRPSDDDPILF